MRYAIISDIHANLEALRAVLHAIEPMSADRLVCLGDIVGYYANPNECIELVRDRAMACVRGNHDSVAAGLRLPLEFSATARRAIQWTSDVLVPANRQYLEDLSLLQVVDDALVIVHAALHPQPNEATRIRNETDARPSLQLLASGYPGHCVCFLGHTHHRTAYVLANGEVAKLDNDELHLDRTSAYLINPGSVGQSRDEDPSASFLIYDSELRIVQFHRINYDHATARSKAVAQGLIRRPHLVMRTLRWLATG